MQLIADALGDTFDVALIISGDSDLSTPLRLIRDRFPTKRVVVAFSPRRSSSELKRLAHGFILIGHNKLEKSQLPDKLAKSAGYVLQCPDNWRSIRF